MVSAVILCPLLRAISKCFFITLHQDYTMSGESKSCTMTTIYDFAVYHYIWKTEVKTAIHMWGIQILIMSQKSSHEWTRCLVSCGCHTSTCCFCHAKILIINILEASLYSGRGKMPEIEFGTCGLCLAGYASTSPLCYSTPFMFN